MIAGERVLGQKKLVLGQCDDRELSVDQAVAAGSELEFQLVIRMLFCFCFGSRWWGGGWMFGEYRSGVGWADMPGK